MKAQQKLYKNGKIIAERGDELGGNNTLVLGFGAKNILSGDDIYMKLKQQYPAANIVTCSTSGEIYDDTVSDDTVSVMAVEFEKTTVRTISININEVADSFAAGEKVFSLLKTEELAYVMIISDGGLVNGSELVRGIEQVNEKNIPVTGGLAGDAANFNYTVVGCNEKPAKGNIVGIGFYGDQLKIGHSSLGGWEIFGPEKKVTRSVSNVLFEIDDKSALELYKQYLGKYANELPGSALLFPLYVRPEGAKEGVVRTILSIDNDARSMTFAGDIPEGSLVRFMKANFDKLIDAATLAAVNSITQFQDAVKAKPKLALLISCVGRKLILGKRIDEEVEAIKEIFGENTLLSGFYSYGEISPLKANARCELHNQTMTITTFNEE